VAEGDPIRNVAAGDSPDGEVSATMAPMTTVEAAATGSAIDLRDPRLYINRELSWLEFNARVLALAENPAVPLLERCKFLAIFASNLDEFFMVRIAVQQEAVEDGRPPSTWDRMPREDVLAAAAQRVRELVARQSEIWHDQVLPELVANGIDVAGYGDLDFAERREADEHFERLVFPALTPLAVGPAQPFPYISGLSLNLGMMVRDPIEGESRFARLKVPPRLPRLMSAGARLVPIEELIEPHLQRLFPGMDVEDSVHFRLTRDADFEISDEAEDLLGEVRGKLRDRRFGHVVRLEVDDSASEAMVAMLREQLQVAERDVYRIRRPLDLTCLWALATLDRPALRDTPWVARTQPRLQPEQGRSVDVFAAIRAGDISVFHPYEDFDTSVVRFVEQAVEDPDVLAIKHTMYRTSGDSPIVRALVRAAEQGKQAVCLVEIKARFDEEANIRWGRSMEEAGVHVVYGQPGLKTHSKLALVIRREGDEVRRYAHIGTGNYNSSTARLYTDLGIFTCREDITEDAADLFNHLTGFSRQPSYRKLLVAPSHMRDGLLAEIEGVIDGHRDGRPGRIQFKCNAIIDGQMVEALYRASRAGVPVEIVCRGIAGFRPGLTGVSDNIRLISIVGRFLEHARIYAFHSGDDSRYLIGSADLMPRNLDDRVEVVTPVEDPRIRRELQWILDTQLADTALAWQLGPGGEWHRVMPADGEPPLDSQEALMDRARRRAASDRGVTDGAVSSTT
jgi:polyphosphate kinase